jgi:hypothetical protein
MRGLGFLLNQKKSNLLFYFLILLVILLSFRFYSAPFFPALNSDHAVTILMLHSFQLPEDIYFWGQDRMGSILPLMGQVPLSMGISALWSESIVHYTILILGFLSFSSFFKVPFFKLLLAVLWFLPPLRMVDFLELSFGIYYSLIGIGIYLLLKYVRDNEKWSLYKRCSYLFMIGLVFILAVWTSDIAVISIFAIAIVILYNARQKRVKVIGSLEAFVFSFLALLGLCFISYAKDQSKMHYSYSSLASYNEIKDMVLIFMESIKDLFLFSSGEFMTSLFSYGLVISIVLLIHKKGKLLTEFFYQNPLALILFLDCLFAIFAVLISKWTLLNGVPRRYFTGAYMSLGISILLFSDYLFQIQKLYKYSQYVIVITFLLAAISGPFSMRYEWPRTLTPRVEAVGELESLGSIGIIGEYWNSYINSVTAPDLIMTTPHELSGSVRNLKRANSVFDKDKLFLIKDLWMDEFPDSLNQFNRVLYRKGESFYLGESYLCEYTTR